MVIKKIIGTNVSTFRKKPQKREKDNFHLRGVDPSLVEGSSISLSEYRALKERGGARSTPSSKPENRNNKVSLQTLQNNGSSKTRKSKYNAKKVEIDGIVFDSKIEGSRYIILKERLLAGLIKDLDTQKRFDIIVNGQKICSYLADFYYYCNERQCFITEDVKGRRLPVYRLKKKLMKAVYDIDIIEIDKDNVDQ